MKQGWEIKKLGEVFTLKAGKSISSDNIKPDGGEKMYPCFGGNGIRGYVDTYIAEGAYPIIGRVGALCGNIQLSQGKFYATEHAIVAYIKSNNIKAEWAALALKSLNLRQYAKGVAQPVISAGQLAELSIPIPPREEQERIVEELDCLSGVIERKREQLRELDALAQLIFYQMFGDPITNEKGWDVKKWGDLFDTILGKMLDKKKQVETDVVLPYIANTNVQWGYFILDDLKTMTFSDKERIKLKLELGDILICEGGESGRCAVWNGANEEILFQKAIHRARVKNGSTIMPMFVSILLKEIKLNGGLKDYISKSTIEHLTGEKLNLVPIICPPLILQQEFADKIEAIEKQKEMIKKSISETETLFNARMDYYFN